MQAPAHWLRSAPRRLAIARAIWAGLAIALIGMVVYSIASTGAAMAAIPESEGSILSRIGLSALQYQYFLFGLELFVFLAFTGASAIIFLSKRDDWMALLVATALITFGATVFPLISAPVFQAILLPMRIFGVAAIALTVFVFPDGRFVPGWTRAVAVGLGLWLAALLIFPGTASGGEAESWWGPAQTVLQILAWLFSITISPDFMEHLAQAVQTIGLVSMLFGWFGAGGAAQIYRYRHHSSPLEKQQTRSVVFGMVFAVGTAILYYLIPLIPGPLNQPGGLHLLIQAFSLTLYTIALILVPLFLVVSILRYRLWDVDSLINRTLVYTVLTGMLGALYYGCIVVFQSVFRSLFSQGSEIAIVAATLLLAALFTPLRTRVQDFIDRRYYRERVDVRKAFADFGRELRTLIDLPTLEKTLVTRVSDLMHVQYGVVFLRGAGGRMESQFVWNLPAGLPVALPEKEAVFQRLGEGGIAYKPSISPFPMLVPLLAARTGGSDLIGILALGPRLSGDQYSREDQSLLLAIADQAGTAIRVAQLIAESRADAEKRSAMERALADHWNSPLGRAEALAERIGAHPETALLAMHQMTQSAGRDPESARLAANLPSALASAGAQELSRLAEGYELLLTSQSDPEVLPAALRTILRELENAANAKTAFDGGRSAQAVYTAALRALSARSITDIAGWLEPAVPLDGGDAHFADLRARLGELHSAADPLRSYERMDAIQDKLAYLAAAMERLNRLHHAAQAALGAADRPILRRVTEDWSTIITGAMGELQSRAQIGCELVTRHTWQGEWITLALTLRNTGRGAALDLQIGLPASADYESENRPTVLPHLAPGGESRVELRVRPHPADGSRRFRVCFEITYTDPRGSGQCESFADTVELLEIAGPFRRIENPYVVGTPLPAGSALFFGRGDVLAFVEDHLAAGHRNNLVLIGQRRTGKSSLLKQLPGRLGDSFLTVYLDGQALVLDPGFPAFLQSVAAEIAFALEDRGMQAAVPPAEDFAERPVETFERKFLPAVRAAMGGRHLLLLLDEFEALESAARRGTLDASVFPFLRHLIQHHEEISVIFCGTHRLEQLASDYWNVLFNISLYRHISFLAYPEAMRLIQEPVAGCGLRFDDLALEKMWRITAGHPYFLQLLCHNLVSRQNRLERNYATVADVNASLDEILTTGEAHFIYLWRESSPEEKLALFALARGENASGGMTPVRAEEELAGRGLRSDRVALAGAFRNLVAREILAAEPRPDLPSGEQFEWKLGLVGLWVEKSISLGRMIEETQPAAGGNS